MKDESPDTMKLAVAEWETDYAETFTKSPDPRPAAQVRAQKATVHEVTRTLNKTESSSWKKVSNAIHKRTDVCRLALAIQLPGLRPTAPEKAKADESDIPSNWDSFKQSVCRVKTAELRQYTGCLPDEWEVHILLSIEEVARLAGPWNVAEQTHRDRRKHERSEEASSDFNGAKNLLVLTDRPFYHFFARESHLSTANCCRR
ncbi:hypothetical protein CGCSCA4_v014760 [Colletotrichum siamense]|uniref:Uncharacterized protein n=1 Tax=Colletotrichum siamense TaxID=690259 RepID=A0A9P5BU72_COLSI|nr:hypothetical protein CGCSCA4_v014760 [Colletotrichum siamense]KAF4845065.1 hypothetical protein CGCSCA2_v013770 [Colletotrichum siamense]